MSPIQTTYNKSQNVIVTESRSSLVCLKGVAFYKLHMMEKLCSPVSYLLFEFQDELARAFPLALGLEHTLMIRQHTLTGFS